MKKDKKTILKVGDFIDLKIIFDHPSFVIKNMTREIETRTIIKGIQIPNTVLPQKEFIVTFQSIINSDFETKIKEIEICKYNFDYHRLEYKSGCGEWLNAIWKYCPICGKETKEV